jgi:hypothetical protein
MCIQYLGHFSPLPPAYCCWTGDSLTICLGCSQTMILLISVCLPSSYNYRNEPPCLANIYLDTHAHRNTIRMDHKVEMVQISISGWMDIHSVI